MPLKVTGDKHPPRCHPVQVPHPSYIQFTPQNITTCIPAETHQKYNNLKHTLQSSVSFNLRNKHSTHKCLTVTLNSQPWALSGHPSALPKNPFALVLFFPQIWKSVLKFPDYISIHAEVTFSPLGPQSLQPSDLQKLKATYNQRAT